ncbi:hypothetical protein BDD12DRAFT_839059 [Trichophaea hybrida]|nr:hypothetical protein BDD12DRAFT_839059 [Trichophaea hybrida]
MYFPITVLSLISLLLTPLVSCAAIAQIPRPKPPTCVVLKPLIFSLSYTFHLEVQNPAYPEIHERSVRYIGIGTPGDYRAVLSPRGSPQKLTFKDRQLSWGGSLKFTGYAKSPDKKGNRQLGFIVGPGKPLELLGKYGCDDENKQQLELSQTSISGWDWCVLKNKDGEWGLYLEDRSRRGTKCIDVKVAVKK